MTKEKVLIKIKSNWRFLRDNLEWNNDKEVVLATIQQNGLALQFASNELRNNKELAMIAIQKNAWALEFVSDELKNDKEVVMAAVQQNGYSLQHSSNELKNDKRVVMAAVKQNGIALQFASNELRNNKNITIAAIQQEAFALQFASGRLRKNKEIILKSVVNYSNACHFSLLKGYQNFDEIMEKEDETFLFSCWNNWDDEIRLRVANHPSFLPTLNQIEIGLQDEDECVKEIYKLRKDEWLAKVEENQLRSII